MLCIKNGRIHDAVHREPYTADILIENGKLLQIGTDLHAEQTIDAAGLETPFGPEALRQVAAKAKEWLEGFDAGKLQ